MSLLVLDAGFHTLVVDGGRRRSRHLGVPLGGAADTAALALANGLVGNQPESPALEVTLMGPTLRATEPTACAVFGAPFGVAIANRGRVSVGSAFMLEAGDTLKIAGTPSGVRAYFTVRGGIDAKDILGSRSSLEPLKASDTLTCPPSRITPRSLGFDALPRRSTLRCVLGPQAKWFLKPDAFFGSPYTVAPASDRMGLRLQGPALERRAGELPSEAVAPGAVQVTNDGLPVVLGVDGQTIGGYPKIAHVIRADLDALGQLKSGELVMFEKVSMDEADLAGSMRDAIVNEWMTRMAVTLR